MVEERGGGGREKIKLTLSPNLCLMIVDNHLFSGQGLRPQKETRVPSGTLLTYQDFLTRLDPLGGSRWRLIITDNGPFGLNLKSIMKGTLGPRLISSPVEKFQKDICHEGSGVQCQWSPPLEPRENNVPNVTLTQILPLRTQTHGDEQTKEVDQVSGILTKSHTPSGPLSP